jgi:hypothetical protein
MIIFLIILFAAAGINFLLWLYIKSGKPIVIEVNDCLFGSKDIYGITIFMLVIISRQYHDKQGLLRHEFEHYRQEIIFSPFVFYLIYLGAILIGTVKYGSYQKGYNESFFEKQADQAMKDDKPMRDYIELG